LDGRDAWPTITAGKASPHDAILLNATPNSGAIRVGTWKLVINGGRGDGGGDTGAQAAGRPANVALFNLADDLSEKMNLAAAMPEKVKELRARYDEFARQAVPPKIRPKPAEFRSPKVWGEK